MNCDFYDNFATVYSNYLKKNNSIIHITIKTFTEKIHIKYEDFSNLTTLEFANKYPSIFTCIQKSKKYNSELSTLTVPQPPFVNFDFVSFTCVCSLNAVSNLEYFSPLKSLIKETCELSDVEYENKIITNLDIDIIEKQMILAENQFNEDLKYTIENIRDDYISLKKSEYKRIQHEKIKSKLLAD